MLRPAYLFAALSVLLCATLVHAQGALIDPELPLPRPWVRPTSRPQAEYRIKSLEVQARIKDQVASVQVSQTFVNSGSTQMEVQFVFPLPYDAAIDQLTLLVDGKELPGELLPADKARARYEEIVRKSKDPALLEWMGHGLFQTSVFPVPAGQARTVTLHYTQLLKKDQGATDFLYPLSAAKFTSKPVEKLEIRVTVDSTVAIRNVYSPTHTVAVDRSGQKQARITLTEKDVAPSSDFRLFFDVNPRKFATSVLSYRPDSKDDGYFLLLTTPQTPERSEQVSKTVVFVVDKSGSMSGEKIEQAKGALKFVLNNLREGDLFNIIAYDSSVESFRPELERFSNSTRQQALGFVEGIYAGGGTNIHDALATALRQLQDRQRPSYVIFLTDGLPTVGERSEAKIAAAAKAANDVRARILNFGVGYDVNSRLLDRLGRENFGASEYVRPNEDIEVHVGRVAHRISSPVLTDVELTFEIDGVGPEHGKVVNRIYPNGVFDLFGGEQVVLVGRYRKPGAAKVVLRGQAGGEAHQYDFPARLVEKSNDQSYAFIEKLWAMRRIGEIIDELDLNGANEELTKELVTLSTRHGILTPYTSFLADENARPTQLATSTDFGANSMESLRRLGLLNEAEGRSGVAQRGAKQDFKAASGLALPAVSNPEAQLSLAAGAAGYRDEATDSFVVAESVRQVGANTLYKRGSLYCTSEASELLTRSDSLKLDLSQMGNQVTVIDRFSAEYFELCNANSTEENRLLASQQDGEQLLVKLRGQAYLIR